MYVCFGPRRVEHNYEFSLVFPQIRVCYIQDSWRSPDVQYHQYFEKSYRLLFVFAESSVGWSFRISEQSRTATFDCLAQPLEETLYMAWFAPLPFSTVLNDISLHKWTLRSATKSSTTNTSYSVDCSPSEWIYGFLFETRLPNVGIFPMGYYFLTKNVPLTPSIPTVLNISLLIPLHRSELFLFQLTVCVLLYQQYAIFYADFTVEFLLTVTTI